MAVLKNLAPVSPTVHYLHYIRLKSSVHIVFSQLLPFPLAFTLTRHILVFGTSMAAHLTI
jgi:hypothetical protein